MRTTRAAAAACCASVLALTACGQTAGSGSTEGAATQPASSAPATSSAVAPSPTTRSAAPGTAITTGNSDFGTMLFDGKQQAIYLFDKETTPTPDCYGDCAEAWPPVLTEGAPAAEGGVNPALLGSTLRTDGTTQVTYGGHPLYYYAHEAAGEVKCHNVRGFGGLWLVVGPDGNRRP